MTKSEHSTIVGDIFGGLTAAVVALPLALAFGVASGVGPIAGLYGAIAVGFFAAILGGTPTQVSGPTGPMTVMMAAIVSQFAHDLPKAFAIVVLGGVLQIGLGLLRVGRYVSYTPYSVVSGFMSGIGIIIILIQTLPFVGAEAVPGGPVGAISAWPAVIHDINFHALAVASISLAIMVFWPEHLKRYLPAPLAALIIGTISSILVFSRAPIIGSVPTGFPALHLPSFGFADLPSMLQPAIILALLGSIDSLLTSLVADSITRTRHDSNRELIGQGVGNMIAGLFGALPGAGATMRTVINVRAGGKTPLSGALHSVVLLALVLGLGPIAEAIPHAVLAGILMKVGWDIIDWQYLKRIRSAPREKVVVMAVTLVLTVFVDLITAVAVGLILAGFVTAHWMEQEELKGVTKLALADREHELTETERELLSRHDGEIAVIELRGRFSYASARELLQRVGTGFSGHRLAIFDFSDAAQIDTSAALSLESLFQSAQEELEGIFICGLTGPAEDALKRLQILERIPADRVHQTRLETITAAGKALDRDPVQS